MARDETTEVRRSAWLESMRWRRRVIRALRGSGLSFVEWLVLDATRRIIERSEDAVSQNDVTACLELDRKRISDAMSSLDAKGLVDRGGSLTACMWRIWLTEKALALLQGVEGPVGAAARDP